MDTIIGLGKTGCSMADQFSVYEEYKIYKIDVALKGLKKNGIYDFPKQPNPEEYEKNCPNMKSFFKNCSGNVLFIVDGSEYISAASLHVLENLYKKKLNVKILYIKQDIHFFSKIAQLTDKIAFNVLQEYTRSGVFERIYLVDMKNIEPIMEHLPLMQQTRASHQLIASTIHMINVYDHIDSATDTFCLFPETARLATLGFGKPDSEINYFYPLDKTREIRYYYGINKKRLETEKGLLKKIKAQLRDNEQEGIRTSYGIFSTSYEEDFVYTLALSAEIQGDKNDKK